MPRKSRLTKDMINAELKRRLQQMVPPGTALTQEVVENLILRILTDPVHRQPRAPPVARLVGVETNPGPTRRRAALVVVPRRTLTRPRTRRRRQAMASAATQSGPARNFLQAYANTLNNPFEYPGVPLGYDCFLPTTQVSGYNRGTFAVSSDGSFSLVVFPSAGAFFQSDNSTVTTPHTGAFGTPANFSAIQNAIDESRVVSCGLRCFVTFPATSASGVIYSGTAPDLNISQYQAFDTQTMASLPGSRIGIGTEGAQVHTRPYDNASFEFFAGNTNGFNSTSIPYHTSGYIVGTGFPAGSTVYYEAVINLEGIARTSVSSMAVPSDDAAAPTLASYFPTPGQLFTAAQRLLSPSVILDGIDMAAGMAHPNTATMLGAATGSVRRLMGLGGHGRWNQFVQQRGRESSVVIEEMKDDATRPSRGWLRV